MLASSLLQLRGVDPLPGQVAPDEDSVTHEHNRVALDQFAQPRDLRPIARQPGVGEEQYRGGDEATDTDVSGPTMAFCTASAISSTTTRSKGAI